MNRPLRLLSVLFAVGAVATLVLGAAGFTTVEANRTVDVAVVDDDEAYLGIKDSVSCGTVDLVENRFATELDTLELEIGAKADDDNGVIKVEGRELDSGESISVSTDDTVGPGEAATIEFDQKMNNDTAVSTPEAITVKIVTARGDGIEATVDEREVDISC